MNIAAEIQRLLGESRAVLKRDGNHQVWELPSGAKYTIGKNTVRMGDLHTLRRLLGVNGGGEPGERRRFYRPKHDRPAERPIFTNNALANQLLLATLEKQVVEMEKEIDALAWFNEQMQTGSPQPCWWCKVKQRVLRWNK